jgi:hypothetical protein
MSDILKNLDILERLRGDPTKGLAATVWQEHLRDVPYLDLARACMVLAQDLLIPGWVEMRGKDERPQQALAAMTALLLDANATNVAALKEASKACTAAKQETYGQDHRVPESIREIGKAILSKEAVPLFDTLALAEEELVNKQLLFSHFEEAAKQRAAMIRILRDQLLPKEADAPRMSITDMPPVPYSPESNFSLGQRITHKKFGEIIVTSVGETWIEAETKEGEKKRLAHKPQPAITIG